MAALDFQLTPQQINFFHAFGYLSLPSLMTDTLDEIIGGFDEVWQAHGNPHEGKERSALLQFIDQSARLSRLMDDPRIHGIVAGLLGEDFTYTSSDGNYYVGDTNWHYDSCYPGLDMIKVAFYLDPLTRETGALRVIPGSQFDTDNFAQNLYELYPSAEAAFGVRGAEVPSVALETQPGDVVVFNQKTLHAAYGGNQQRRMFTLNFSQRYPADRLDVLRTYLAHTSAPGNKSHYGKALLETATPQRMIHLEQVLAIENCMAVPVA